MREGYLVHKLASPFSRVEINTIQYYNTVAVGIGLVLRNIELYPSWVFQLCGTAPSNPLNEKCSTKNHQQHQSPLNPIYFI